MQLRNNTILAGVGMVAIVIGTEGLMNTNVAVLGSGVAGSTAARQLAEAGVKVTVFECGFGVGGRTSTRVCRDENRFAFDHGAQYIGKPNTELFQNALTEWETSGFVKEWNGRFAEVDAAMDIPISSEDAIAPTIELKYVGYPAMHSICRNLLQHKNIRVVLQTRACAVIDDGNDGKKWTITSHGDRQAFGQFDWLVGSDRLSATNNRADLRDAPVHAFKSQVEPIENVPSLTLMVAFESPLEGVPFDGIKFGGEEFGSLGWMARDTSKPGRERSDGQECWVVQSTSTAAQQVLASVEEHGIGATEGTTSAFQDKKEKIRELAKEMLLADFLSAIPKLSLSSQSPNNDAATVAIPKIVSAVGHRWSAAFPLMPQPNDDDNDDRGRKEEYAYADTDQHFVACGDYLGKMTGRVEGAYLSGRAAATAILSTTRNES